jgi:hypothetical protein
MVNYLVETLHQHCHDRMWYAKRAVCRFLFDLTVKYFSKQFIWLQTYFRRILHGYFHVIVSLTDEISSGTLDSLSSMIKDLLDY